MTRARLLAVLLASLVAGGCAGSSDSSGQQAAPVERATTGTDACSPAGRARLEPADGAWFGVNLDWEHDSPEDYGRRLGQDPAVFVEFAAFPHDDAAWGRLDRVIDKVAARGAMALLTLEPHAGLDAVTPGSAAELGDRLAAYNRQGVPVFVRFAHEMNGSWYPWSHQPEAYVTAFRMVAAAVHDRAPATATVWAPNYGGGYPFAGGAHEARPVGDRNGVAAAKILGHGLFETHHIAAHRGYPAGIQTLFDIFPFIANQGRNR